MAYLRYVEEERRRLADSIARRSRRDALVLGLVENQGKERLSESV